MNKEIWKDAIGYKGYYQVSNLGNVRSIERKVKTGRKKGRVVPAQLMKARILNTGYFVVDLQKNNQRKTCKVHRLVALAFMPNPLYKFEVNHKNGNKLDNRLHNLEWVSKSANTRHALLMGLKKTKVTPLQVKKVRSFYIQGMNQKLIANLLGITRPQVSHILTSRSWSFI